MTNAKHGRARDVGMPVEDGLSMMRTIRQRPPPARGGFVRECDLSVYAACGSSGCARRPAMTISSETGNACRCVVRAVDRWLASAAR